MQLRDLLGSVDVLEVSGDSNVEIADIVLDSRRAHSGALFCCIRGSRFDGHDLAADAVDRGAVALLTERRVPLDVVQARVPFVRPAIGPLAAQLLGHPSEGLQVLGVTGTNGKTTTTYLLESMSRAAGRPCGVIGTSGAFIGDRPIPIGLTTPEATDVQALLAEMSESGASTVAMEVSSHALAQHRIDGTHFAVACFTNLSHDHLDFHGTVEAYFAAKARLFTPELTTRGVVNLDDRLGAALSERSNIPITTFGTSRSADIVASDIRPGARSTTFVVAADGSSHTLESPLVGRFNVSNVLAAVATPRAAGLDWDAIIEGARSMAYVPGRFERIPGDDAFSVFVDYAHTPDAVETVLDAARALASERVIAVFGCGGDRDKAKRPEMGAAVGERADVVFLTNDNPRSEDPREIAASAARGLDASGASYTVELDRRRAIRAALEQARRGDVVMILGKGAEQGQEAGGSIVPFDDRSVAREALEELSCG